jgi:hypothetical protein
MEMWVLYNFKTLQTVYSNPDTHYRQWGKDLVLSSLGQKQFDCAEKRHQRPVAAGFSDNMGTGNVVWSDDDGRSRLDIDSLVKTSPRPSSAKVFSEYNFIRSFPTMRTLGGAQQLHQAHPYKNESMPQMPYAEDDKRHDRPLWDV